MNDTPDCTACTGCSDEDTTTRAIGRRDLLAAGAKLGALATVASFVRGVVGVAPSEAGTVKRTVAKTSKVPMGTAYAFRDPYNHAPAYVLQPTKGHFIALSRVCPHMGCTANFTKKDFVCPCHGSEFTETGALVHGPATRGLTSLPVSVSNGQIYIER